MCVDDERWKERVSGLEGDRHTHVFWMQGRDRIEYDAFAFRRWTIHDVYVWVLFRDGIKENCV